MPYKIGMEIMLSHTHRLYSPMNQITIFRKAYTWYPMRQRRVETLMVWHAITSSETLRSKFISFRWKNWNTFSSFFSRRILNVLLPDCTVLRGVRQLLPFSSLLNISRWYSTSAAFFSFITLSRCWDIFSTLSLFCPSSGKNSNMPNSRVNMNRKFFMLQRYTNSY